MTNEELVTAIKAGDDSKLLELWEQNSGFIHRKAYAWKMAFPQVAHVDIEDLVSVSWLAMVDAIKYFDPEREDATFLTAFSWFQKKYFYQTLGIHQGRKISVPPYLSSLDLPISADDPDGDTFVDMLEDENAEADFYQVEIAYEQAQIRAVLDEVAADSLSPNERMVYEAAMRGQRFLTGSAYAEETGKNRERLRQLKEQMLEILRTDTRVMQLWLSFTGQDEKIEEVAERCIHYAGTKSFSSYGSSSVELAVMRMFQKDKRKINKADMLGNILWQRAFKASNKRVHDEYEERRRRRLEEAPKGG